MALSIDRCTLCLRQVRGQRWPISGTVVTGSRGRRDPSICMVKRLCSSRQEPWKGQISTLMGIIDDDICRLNLLQLGPFGIDGVRISWGSIDDHRCRRFLHVNTNSPIINIVFDHYGGRILPRQQPWRPPGFFIYNGDHFKYTKRRHNVYHSKSLCSDSYCLGNLQIEEESADGWNTFLFFWSPVIC
jgi:hypothetical protein